MAAIDKFRKSMEAHHVDPAVIARVMDGYEGITDQCKKERPAFFVHAMQVMDEMLDFRTRCEVIDACACSKHTWRKKAVRQIAREYKGRSLEERLEALGQVKYMGNPVLNEDGTITGGVGTEGGFDCPCPIFAGWKHEEPVSATYCLCCGGHFRYHYEIALGVKLRTKAVLSTALESMRREPCRFVYEVESGGRGAARQK
jgi:hypothetical protein